MSLSCFYVQNCIKLVSENNAFSFRKINKRFKSINKSLILVFIAFSENLQLLWKWSLYLKTAESHNSECCICFTVAQVVLSLFYSLCAESLCLCSGDKG